jgi:aryl-alcohol dehydrogenase-like predicted oxidoreductase
MNYVNLGKTGLKVSRICLGCMRTTQSVFQRLKSSQQTYADSTSR